MGMCSYVTGLRDSNDPQYLAVVEAVRACVKANLPLPEEIDRYFGPNAVGSNSQDILKHHLEGPLEVEIPSREWTDNVSRDGIEVNVEDIPSGVKIIRFINSYWKMYL